MSQQQNKHRTSMLHRPGVRRNLSIIATAALLTAGLATGAAFTASATPALTTTPTSLNYSAGIYLISMGNPSAASYTGGVAGLAATRTALGTQLDGHSTQVKAYASYLKSQQVKLAKTVGVTPMYHYTYATNGFAAKLTAAQATTLAKSPGVISIERDSTQQLDAESSTSFLGLEGSDGVWASNGGVAKAGAGTVVGVLDTGIAPENPSFAGAPLGDVAGTDPYYTVPGITSYVKADGGTFSGLCQVGAEFSLTDCTTKIIGARMYPTGFAAAGGTPISGEYLSPRDGNDHGSHTASTAAGNHNVAANVNGRAFGMISGVAPAAKIAAYKVCWTGAALSGCQTTDLVAAIDQAVLDGVDVLSFSIGGGSATTTVSTTTGRAFLGAAEAGIFVSAAAGNSGPGASTLDNAAPWITTVAASTIPSYEGTVEIGNARYAGATITVAAPVTGTMIAAADAALAGTTTPELCEVGELDPAKTAGKIVVCDRGVNARADKSIEVKRAGGIGMILANVIPGDVDLDEHAVPSIHVDSNFHDAIVASAKSGATATLVEGNTSGITSPTPQVAGFSSRGPVLADGSDLLKPDIAAPGVSILAASANPLNGAPTWMFMSGTSMATPHIAGIALLYFGVHPNASPSEVKSAMMTTAYNTLDAEGAVVTDPFAQGAGQVAPAKFFAPGLLYLNGASEWASYMKGTGYLSTDLAAKPVDGSDLNLASISVGSLTAPQSVTRTVTATQAGTFTATIDGLTGVGVTVTPSTLSFAKAGETKTFTVTFDKKSSVNNAWVTGSLDWTSGMTRVHSPIAVLPVAVQPDTTVPTLLVSPNTAAQARMNK